MEIIKFKPCPPAIEYRKQFNSFEDAWNSCPRGDWMLWIASKLQVDKRLLVKTAGRCAATVKHLMTDPRSSQALQACEDYGNGLINDAELASYAAAAAAAYAAADAAYVAAAAAAAAYVADAAAYVAAAYVAYAAAAYAYAAYVAYAYAAADAADAAYAYAAYVENQLLTANICRELLTEEVFNKINNK